MSKDVSPSISEAASGPLVSHSFPPSLIPSFPVITVSTMDSTIHKDTSAPSAARVGIGGPVGAGKTALLERLIGCFSARGIPLSVITNDLVTKEDAERVQ